MKNVVREFYNRIIRPFTPRKIAVFNGIAVRGVRLFDMSDVHSEYEAPLIAGIRSRVTDGDDVVVVGGGRGVSSVAAAHRTGRSGTVTTFEGSADRVTEARETIDLNEMDEIVTVQHTVVGEAVKLADAMGDARSISPTDLPECDVLVLDCEGAELDILDSLEISPRTIVVETHDFLDSPEEEVMDSLNGLGYTVVERGVENEELGAYVLTAVDEE